MKIEWSSELRVNLYKALLQTWGKPDSINFDQNGKPYSVTKKDFISKLDDIGYALGLGKGKGGALSNQISWAYRTPRSYAHAGHWNNHFKNEQAAIDAGYFDDYLINEPCVKEEDVELYSFAWFVFFIKTLFGIK